MAHEHVRRERRDHPPGYYARERSIRAAADDQQSSSRQAVRRVTLGLDARSARSSKPFVPISRLWSAQYRERAPPR